MKQTSHRLIYMFFNKNKYNIILAITRTNNEITITINICIFTNLSVKLIFYSVKCEDLSCIIYIDRRECVRELNVYKSCKA